jgi:hypothetical protein
MNATSSLAIYTLVLIPARALETITQELRRPIDMPAHSDSAQAGPRQVSRV